MKKTIIIYGYKYSLLIHFTFWFLLNIIFNLYYSLPYYCEGNPWDKPYDGRTCYEIMNEPDPYKYYDEDVARIDYYYDRGEIIPYVDCFNAYVPDSSIESYSSNNSSFNSDSEEVENSDGESGSVSDTSSNGSLTGKTVEFDFINGERMSFEDFMNDIAFQKDNSNNINSMQPLNIHDSADKILKDFFNKTSTIVDTKEFIHEAMTYVKNLIPEDMWHKNVNDAKQANSSLNIWLDHINTTATTNTISEKESFLHLYTAVTITNINNFDPIPENLLVDCYKQILDSCTKMLFEVPEEEEFPT